MSDAQYFPYMTYFNSEQFNAELLANCEGQQICRTQLSMSSFAIPADLQTPTGQFAFAQVACKSGTEELHGRESWGLLTACIGLFMCFIYMFTMTYGYTESLID